jgi:hypothetical protein
MAEESEYCRTCPCSRQWKISESHDLENRSSIANMSQPEDSPSLTASDDVDGGATTLKTTTERKLMAKIDFHIIPVLWVLV